MAISMIYASNPQGVIGFGNTLPWNIKEDMRYFVEVTRGKAVIMGRKTFDSLPGGPLKGRTNIVLSRSPNWSQDGCVVFNTPEEAVEYCKEHDLKAVIIGGAEIYDLMMPYVDVIHQTVVHTEFTDDALEENRAVFIKDVPLYEFELKGCKNIVAECGVSLSFNVYHRKDGN